MELECNRCKNKKIRDGSYCFPWFICTATKIVLCDLCNSSFKHLMFEIEQKILKTFIQPERSKREDSCENGHDWMHIPLSDVVDCRRCGALNTMET
jgi:hypothetical protein